MFQRCPWQIRASNSFGQQSQGNPGWCIPRQIENYNSVSTDLPKTLHQVIFACFVCSSHAFFTRSRCPFYLFAPHTSINEIYIRIRKGNEGGRPTLPHSHFQGGQEFKAPQLGRVISRGIHNFDFTSLVPLILHFYIPLI